MDDRARDADDLMGPGSGGSPTGPEGMAADPEVAALVDNLRSDVDDEEDLATDVATDVADAAEQTGTGTDR